MFLLFISLCLKTSSLLTTNFYWFKQTRKFPGYISVSVKKMVLALCHTEKKERKGRKGERKMRKKKKLSRYKNWSCKKRKSKKQRRELTNWHLAKSNKGEKGKLCNMDSTNPKTEFYQMRSYVNQIRFFCIIKTDTNDTI